MVNDALVKMLGYDSAKELLALNLATDVFDKGEYTPLLFDQPGTRKQFARLGTHWKRKDGKTIPVEISGRAVRDDDGKVLYFEVIAENVSHVRGVEQRLRHVQKMEAIGRLAGGIAHDFNNVLGVIVAYSEMLVEKLQGQRRTVLSGVVHQQGRGARRNAHAPAPGFQPPAGASAAGHFRRPTIWTA